MHYTSLTEYINRRISTEEGRINMTTKKKSPDRVEKSSGNVFADLGLPHPEQELSLALSKSDPPGLV